MVSITHSVMPMSGKVMPASSFSITSCSVGPAPRPQGFGQCGTRYLLSAKASRCSDAGSARTAAATEPAASRY